MLKSKPIHAHRNQPNVTSKPNINRHGQLFRETKEHVVPYIMFDGLKIVWGIFYLIV